MKLFDRLFGRRHAGGFVPGGYAPPPPPLRGEVAARLSPPQSIRIVTNGPSTSNRFYIDDVLLTFESSEPLKRLCSARCAARGDFDCWRINEGEDSVDVRWNEHPCVECVKELLT